MARASSDAADLPLSNSVSSDARDRRLPLVVDMDGFLIQADISADTRIAALERQVARLRRAVRGETCGVSAQTIAEYARKGVDVSQLPLQNDFAAYVIGCIEMGRAVHLVTSASQEIADAVAARVGVFASVVGAAAGRSMTIANKLGHVRAHCPQGFVYAGREPALIGAAEAVVIASRDRATLAAVRGGDRRVEALIEQPMARAGTWTRLLGSASWLRHAMVFVPVLLAPAPFSASALGLCAGGFVLLCLVASSASVIEGLMRLYEDRRDMALRHRVPALGEVDPGVAAAAAVLLGAGSLAAAIVLSTAAFLCVAGFMGTLLAWAWVRRQRSTDRRGYGSGCAPVTSAVWALALGAVLAGLTPAQTVPAILVVLAVTWVQRYGSALRMLRVRGDVRGLDIQGRAVRTRR